MADYQAPEHVVDAARRALDEEKHFQLGRLLAAEMPSRGGITSFLSSLAERVNCSLSSLNYVIGAYRLAEKIGLSEDDFESIGYTKLAVVASYADAVETRADLLALCDNRTVTEIKAAMGGVAGDVKVVTFNLNKKQRRALDAALIRHGAVRVGRGLQGKEDALMNLLAEAR